MLLRHRLLQLPDPSREKLQYLQLWLRLLKLFLEDQWPATSAGAWLEELYVGDLGNVAESTTHLIEEE